MKNLISRQKRMKLENSRFQSTWRFISMPQVNFPILRRVQFRHICDERQYIMRSQIH